MRTLLLDTALWDLCKDAAGNIACADAPYAPAQDVASAVRLFLGEAWYAINRGVPYFQNILGRPAQMPFIKAQFTRAALTVPGVVGARVVLSIANRVLTGTIYVDYVENAVTYQAPITFAAMGDVIRFVGLAGNIVSWPGTSGAVLNWAKG